MVKQLPVQEWVHVVQFGRDYSVSLGAGLQSGFEFLMKIKRHLGKMRA
jgi:hypothetical protein